MNSDLYQTKDGSDTKDCLKKAKVVCLFFAAHWCPPCRAFTPKLIKFYG